MVESDNQQQIYKWVRTNINLPSVKGQTYTQWYIRQSYKQIILDKSSYSEIIVKFGIPESTLTYFLKVIFQPLKRSSLKHLWDIIGVEKITNRRVRKVIDKVVVTKKRGNRLTFSRMK